MTTPDVVSMSGTPIPKIENEAMVLLGFGAERKLSEKRLLDVVGEEALKKFLANIDSELQQKKPATRLEIGRAISRQIGMFDSKVVQPFIGDFFIVVLTSESTPNRPLSVAPLVSYQPQSSAAPSLK